MPSSLQTIVVNASPAGVDVEVDGQPVERVQAVQVTTAPGMVPQVVVQVGGATTAAVEGVVELVEAESAGDRVRALDPERLRRLMVERLQFADMTVDQEAAVLEVIGDLLDLQDQQP